MTIKELQVIMERAKKEAEPEMIIPNITFKSVVKVIK